jgi:hypothetical protein
LADVWHHFTDDQKDKVVSQVATFEGQLLSKRFESIGSPFGNPFDSNFQVGPTIPVSGQYVPLDRNFGPWNSSMDYIMAYMEAEIHLLENESDKWHQQRTRWIRQNGGQNALSLTDATSCYKLFMNGLCRLDLSAFQGLDYFTLFHEDLCIGNIMVSYDDPAHIVAIVDWEGSKIVPIWRSLMYDGFLEANLEEPEELQRLRDLRSKVRGGIEPAALHDFQPLQFLLGFVTYRSARLSLEALNKKFERWFEVCPQEQVYLFNELRQFLQAGGFKLFALCPLYLTADSRINDIECLRAFMSSPDILETLISCTPCVQY